MQGARASRIRTADARDLDRIVELWIAITRHHESLDPLFQMRAGAERELTLLLRSLLRDPDAAILVFDEDGDLPAMCIVRIDRAPPILVEVERAEITDLGVRPSHRRRGIGTQLVEEALAWVRSMGVARVEVQVARGNEEGQGFWHALGFGPLMDVLQKRL